MGRLFSTHPATGNRIRIVEETITTVLPPAVQYVESTSGFNTVKARLTKVQNRYRPDEENRPTLQRRTLPPKGDLGK
jgi:hypothetical protein